MQFPLLSDAASVVQSSIPSHLWQLSQAEAAGAVGDMKFLWLIPVAFLSLQS